MIASPVHCCRCTYDLRGLPADGRCPECGLAIFDTVQHIVDPAASHLPRLRDPVGVGNAIVWLTLCCFIAVALLAAQAAIVWLEVVHPRSVGMFGVAPAHDLTLLASLAGLASLWSVYKFFPARSYDGSITVRLDVWLLGLGLAGWAVLTMVLWQRERYWSFAVVRPEEEIAVRSLLHIALVGSAVTMWIGMQRVLNTIGKRSRAYRSAHSGRQNIRPMIAATIAIAFGSILRMLDMHFGAGESLAQLGTVIVSVSMLMLLIGLGYLVINSWWIRQALRHPPPKLQELLAPIA
jgi:hypothetical protein